MFGEPTTPPFSIAAFISSEANQVRAFATNKLEFCFINILKCQYK